MLGIVHSNYAGTNGILLNPSSISNSQLKWDVNIVTAGLFFDNNYLFLPKTSLLNIGSTISNISGQDYSAINDYDNTRKKSAYFNMQLRGPSVMVSKKKYSFGFYTGFRTAISARKLHYSIAKFAYEGLDYKPLQGTSYVIPGNTNMNMMGWSEVGFSYAKKTNKNFFTNVTAGATIKILQGYGSIFINIDQMEYSVPNDKTVSLTNLNAGYGYIDPYSYEDQNGNRSYSSILKGMGLGIDLGITISQKETRRKILGSGVEALQNKKRGWYHWKLGISLIDVGSINFNKNASTYQFKGISGLINNVDSNTFSNRITSLDTLLSNKLLNDPSASYNNGKYRMNLPTGLSIQYDYHLTKHVYINSTLILNVSYRKIGIDRANVLAVTPRFETKWFEVNIPVVLYQMRYPRIGAAVRLWVLTVGSDKVGSLFIPGNFTGFDIYASIRVFALKWKKRPYYCPLYN